MIRLLPKVSAATALVAVSPVWAVWGLTRLGVVRSPLLAAGLGAALSLAVYHLAATVWQRRTDAADILFGDLMLWGWLRRCVHQRRIADAAALLGARRGTATHDPMQLSPARRVQLLEQLASDLEARDPYTLGHSRRVARYSALIAKRMGVPNAELSRIRTAAAVHDIGKLRTPLEVLHKPGALTDAEFELIKLHPADGAQMVEILEDEAMTEIVLRHHERLDGSGYPGGLRGEQTPLGARIIAVADTFDAITSSRSYRAARPHKQALDILRTEAGSRLDGEAVDAFLSAYLGRRTFGIWVAVTNLMERLLAWLASDALGTGTRLAAIAAGTAAVGSGALGLHGPATLGRPRASAPRVVLSRDPAASGALPLAGARPTATGSRVPAAGPPSRGFRFTTGTGPGSGRPGAGAGGPAVSPAAPGPGAAPAPSSGAGGEVSAVSVGGLSTAVTGSHSPAVSVAAGSPAGPAKIGLGVGRSASSGAPSISLGVGSNRSAATPGVGAQLSGSASGGSSGRGTLSAGASVGPASAGVTATVGGSSRPQVGVSVGGLPPIKIG